MRWTGRFLASVLVWRCAGFVAGAAAASFDSENPPPESLLREYIDPGTRDFIPTEESAALRAYLAGKDDRSATALELEAVFVEMPPAEETLARLLVSDAGVPQNLSDAVWTYLYNSPIEDLSPNGLRVMIRNQEEAQAKVPNPEIYEDGLTRMREALAVKTKGSGETREPEKGEGGTSPPARGGSKSPSRPPSSGTGRASGGRETRAATGAGPGELSSSSGGVSLASLGAPPPPAVARAMPKPAGSAAGWPASRRGRIDEAKASGKVGAMGNRLNSAFDDGDRLGAARSDPGAGEGRRSGSRREEVRSTDLPAGMTLAAAHSVYGDSFRSMGLKMGSRASAGRVVREDGSPASDADRAGLLRRIAAEPRARMRRPDFFEVVDRESFDRLKTDFHEKPDARDTDFRHIGLTEAGRDFERTASCSPGLDRNCNPHAKSSYTKGEYVSPEDLKAIDEALHSEEPEAFPEERAAGGGSGGGALSKPAWRIYGDRLKALFRGFRGGRAGPESGADAPRGRAEAAGSELAGAPVRRRPLFHLWQGAALAVLFVLWLAGKRRRNAFFER